MDIVVSMGKPWILINLDASLARATIAPLKYTCTNLSTAATCRLSQENYDPWWGKFCMTSLQFGHVFWTFLVVGQIQVGKTRKPLQFCNDCHVRVKKHTIWDFLRCFGTAVQTTRVKHLGVPSNLCTTSAVCRLGRDCHRKPKFLHHQFHVRQWVLLSDDSRTYYVTSANFSEWRTPV